MNWQMTIKFTSQPELPEAYFFRYRFSHSIIGWEVNFIIIKHYTDNFGKKIES